MATRTVGRSYEEDMSMVVAWGRLIGVLVDPDAGPLVVLWMIGDEVFLKNRIWMRWF